MYSAEVNSAAAGFQTTDENASDVKIADKDVALDSSRIGNRTADLAREIEVNTDWKGTLEKTSRALSAEQFQNEEVWLVNELLSAEECTRLLVAAEQKGFGATQYPKGYRGNLRLLATDPGLADAVWHRLQPLVPATLSLDDGDVWEAVGLNECWRLAKYHEGDQFKGHCDACFDRNKNEMSMLTVNIYMNGDFEGGATRFYFNERDRKQADLSVTPKAGLCLLFRQPPGQAYYHDGEQLSKGVKYLFRSDVMYRLVK